MNRYHVAEYEGGWFVEEPDPKAPLEDCKFLTLTGPYKTERDAQIACDRFNWAKGRKPVFPGKRLRPNGDAQ